MNSLVLRTVRTVSMRPVLQLLLTLARGVAKTTSDLNRYIDAATHVHPGNDSPNQR